MIWFIQVVAYYTNSPWRALIAKGEIGGERGEQVREKSPPLILRQAASWIMAYGSIEYHRIPQPVQVEPPTPHCASH
jgi:hypothetical protein